MRRPALWVVLLVPVGLGAAVALAQTPAPAPRAPATGMGATTTAPLPNVMPGVPGNTGPGALPEQIAPPGLSAGPVDATPFSAGPSAMLPSDQSVVLGRDNPSGGQSSPAPNLSK